MAKIEGEISIGYHLKWLREHLTLRLIPYLCHMDPWSPLWSTRCVCGLFWCLGIGTWAMGQELQLYLFLVGASQYLCHSPCFNAQAAAWTCFQHAWAQTTLGYALRCAGMDTQSLRRQKHSEVLAGQTPARGRAAVVVGSQPHHVLCGQSSRCCRERWWSQMRDALNLPLTRVRAAQTCLFIPKLFSQPSVKIRQLKKDFLK